MIDCTLHDDPLAAKIVSRCFFNLYFAERLTYKDGIRICFDCSLANVPLTTNMVSGCVCKRTSLNNVT